MSIFKVNIFVISIICSNLFAVDGYINIGKTQTEKSWDFMPKITNSFKSSDTSYAEIFMYSENIGIKLKSSEFFLGLERQTFPKKLNLNAYTNDIEFFYLNDNQSKSISLSFSEQSADDQYIDCYNFSNIVIGSCAEARLNIINKKEKYNSLNETNIIKISGENESVKLNFNSIKGFNYLYEYNLFIEFVTNNFNWLTPVEEISLNKGSFLYNLNFRGDKLGNIIDNSLSILPQKNNWNSIVIGASTKSYFNLFNSIYLFIEPTVIFVEQDGYSQISEIPEYNLKVKSGFVYALDKIQISFFGEYFKNNLYGFEHISFNQRSEHHFNSNFGSLGIELKYIF